MTLPGFHSCELCNGSGLENKDYWSQDADECPECGGAGQVPDDDTVEAVARVLLDNDPAYSPPYWDDCDVGQKHWYRKMARAALLAYARHTQETKP